MESKLKVLLLGSNGYLGSFLYEQLSDLFLVETHSNSNRYDYIVNCAGKPSLEFCEDNPDVSWESNVGVLKKAIEIPHYKIIHFSSYYVYDDKTPCSEHSKTTGKYIYTKHKLESEEICIKDGGLCLRLGKLFGHPYRKQGKLTDAILERREINLDSVLFNPTSLRQVLNVITFELNNRILQGLYNTSNDGVVSHFDYGTYIRRKVRSSCKINKVENIRRMFHNYGRFAMDVSKLKNVMKLTHWHEDMEQYLRGIDV